MGPRSLFPLLALLLPALASGQPAAVGKAPAAKQSSFREEFLHDLDDVQKKVLDLAGTVPADKYAWRPGEGVRSVSEVYMHIAGANYVLSTFLGVQPPADMPKDIEKITDKKRVLAELQKSFDHVRGIARTIADADLEQPVKLFGSETTKRGVFVTVLNHLHEHLGQSVAYARMNGIVPPWSVGDGITSTPPAPAPRAEKPSPKRMKRN
jgi:uncharacterized damage-inducible protein DinB